MEQFERDFKGIWIPKEVWLDNRLNALDKIILMEINSLDNGETGCYASNKYLAEFCQCTETKVSTTITKLKKFGYIELESFDGRHRILKSKTQALKNLKADIKNFNSNNIYNNLENNKLDKSNLYSLEENTGKDIMPSKELSANIKCIIDYLNESINAKYKYNTKETINLIKARFKDGYVLDDFYDVIDKKVKEWLGTDMEQYLRPSTLFGNKFENYVNQKTYFKGNAKTTYGSKPSFDNTANHKINNTKITDEEFDEMLFDDKKDYVNNMALADMTKKQKLFFNQFCIAKDENGNDLEF